MAYDDTLATDLDWARWQLGDTSNDAATELLTDDHIEAVLSLYPRAQAVGLMAAGLAVRFAQKPTDVSLPSGLRVAWSKRIDQWNKVAATASAGGLEGGATAFSIAPTRTDGYADYAAEQSA